MHLQTHTSESFDSAILNIVRSSALSLSTRDIACRLRARHVPVPDYAVTKCLRGMLHAGQVQYRRGKWTHCTTEVGEISRVIPPKSITIPPHTPELESLLKGIKQN